MGDFLPSYEVNRLPLDKRIQVLNMLVEGSSLRATARVSGVAFNTVLRLLADAGDASMDFHDSAVRHVQTRHIQADELWSYCYAKAKNVPHAVAAPEEAGDLWTWIAIDSDSKLVVSWHVSETRGIEHSTAFMQDLQSRIAGRVQLSTDGMLTYPEAVERAFGRDIDYAQLIKSFDADEDRPKFVRKIPVTGNPDLELTETAYVERHNLTTRMSVRRFTRLTNAFSKTILNHRRALALYITWYNFIRHHSSIRATPAMAAGLAEYPRGFDFICEIVDERMPPLAPRGPYRTRR